MLRTLIAKRSTVNSLLGRVGELEQSLAVQSEGRARSEEALRTCQSALDTELLQSADLRSQYATLEAEQEATKAQLEQAKGSLASHLNFAGHYYDWRVKRQRVIVDHFGADWFKGKKILELACGYGDIGAFFMSLGADVTFSEARQEHLDMIRSRYPSISEDRLVQWNAEDGIPEGQFDLIIHMGLLYHLDNWQASIAACSGRTTHIVLETEVIDSSDPEAELKVEEEGADQSFVGRGSRPSAPFVEAVLKQAGFSPEMQLDGRLNSSFHTYDWEVTEAKDWRHGLRRFWFANASRM